MLNLSRIRQTLTTAVTVLTLSACGGGGNESGDPDMLTVAPGAVTVSGPTGVCGVGIGPEVHVWGGQPPYKLTNSVPGSISLSKSKLENSGDGFTIEFFGGCLDKMPVTIEDDMGRLTSLLVSNVPGE